MRSDQIFSLILIFIFFSLGLPVNAKNKKKDNPKADIKVSYNYHNIFLKGNDLVTEREIPFLLLANTKDSKFYCPDTEYKDSLKSTPEGKQISNKMLSEAVKHWIETKEEGMMESVVYKTTLYVYKSFVENQYDVYENVGLNRAHYIEPLDFIEWEIVDSTKNILGYESIMAEGDYHGRNWTVWFTPEIPIQDGPWKFQGLPGLILEASEPSGQHFFIATGIENSNQEILPVYNPKQYDKSTRIEMLKMMRYFNENQNSIVKAQIDLDLGPDRHLSEEYKKYDYLETDYH